MRTKNAWQRFGYSANWPTWLVRPPNGNAQRGHSFSALTLTPAAQTKAELSAYAPAKRIPLLIDTLARKRVLTFDDDFLIQLLINEGPAARPQIIARLEMMRQKTRNELPPSASRPCSAPLRDRGRNAAATVGSFRNDEEERVGTRNRRAEIPESGPAASQVIAY